MSGIESFVNSVASGSYLLDLKECNFGKKVDEQFSRALIFLPSAGDSVAAGKSLMHKAMQIGMKFITTDKLSTLSKVAIFAVASSLGARLIQKIPGVPLVTSLVSPAAYLFAPCVGLVVMAAYLSYKLGLLVKGHLPSLLPSLSSLKGLFSFDPFPQITKPANVIPADQPADLESQLAQEDSAQNSEWAKEYNARIQERARTMAHQNWGEEFIEEAVEEDPAAVETRVWNRIFVIVNHLIPTPKGGEAAEREQDAAAAEKAAIKQAELRRQAALKKSPTKKWIERQALQAQL
jgi:hypothetical protein